MSCQKVWTRIHLFEAELPKNFIDGDLRQNYGRYIFGDFQNSISQHAEQVQAMSIYLERIIKLEQEINETVDPSIKRFLYRELYNLVEDYPSMKREETETIPGIKCPEECPGIVSFETGICNICNGIFCLECEKVKNSDHVCQQEDLQTIRGLSHETKPCPRCKVRIFRTGGCSQMWCIQCHTAFDWHTGEIERGLIHNPHYTDWIKERRRFTILGQTMPDVFHLNLQQFSHEIKQKIVNVFEQINELTRDTTHEFEEWDEPRLYRVNGRVVAVQKSEHDKYIELMARWVLKAYDDARTTKILLMRDKGLEKKAALRDLKEWLAQSAGAIFANLDYDAENPIISYDEFLSYLNPILNLYNERAKNLGRVFNSIKFTLYK